MSSWYRQGKVYSYHKYYEISYIRRDDEMLLQYYFQIIIQNYSSIFRFKTTNKLIVF
jgi:hypothetical protein